MVQQSGSRVTVLGLGMMGSALAGAFLGAGHATTVWNRSRDKAEALAAKGATAAESAAAAVAASPVTVLCLSTYEAVDDVLAPLAGQVKGRVLVNLTSGTPAEARETAAWAEKHGARYLDGAIMAIPPGIGAPETLLFYGGDAELYAEHEELLKKLGGNSTYLSADHGVPALYDLALLGMLWTTLTGYLQALALVGTEKVTSEMFAPYAAGWLNAVALPTLPLLGQEVDRGQYATDISTLDVNRAGLAHLIEASHAQGVSAEPLIPIRDLIERRVAQGHGADSFSSLVELLKNPEK